ncbi:beta-lactamase family protein [Actinoplanes sp. TRM 88003]|uniref:Beta-lactamase family protein n=1 Tax=Paractinoplanes aksuensis TaxID=2939490 RepID=A0ABT1DTY2_9ACTN|nr:serine hydrolase domain-containing protein [Actinoplanes aksuensis]MCO8274299.1 beta-lactamase family protein [Actinoplanes aksuensis]
MTFAPKRLTRLRTQLQRRVDDGFAPGMLALLSRRGQVHVEATGYLAYEGPGATTPMATDTIVRIASMSKPIVSACAMTLVEDGTLRLDDPVDEFLPELANMSVLADPSGPLDHTVPAERAITLRDLLTYTLGTGMVPAEPGTVPIADALDDIGFPPPADFLTRLGALPLVHQPGERWLYDTAAAVTGELIARATGTSFGAALRERVFEPLGMTDTGFVVSPGSMARFATAYDAEVATKIEDGPDGLLSRQPAFENGGGGLASTADDYLAFASALMAGGRGVLSRPSVRLMTTDHLTPAQKAVSGFRPDYFADRGWGFGMSVQTSQNRLGLSAGAYGWPGYYGTAWYNDPAEDLTAIFIVQRAHAGDQTLPLWTDLWTAVYQAIDD